MIMKYGFDGAGHCAGSGDRHEAGSPFASSASQGDAAAPARHAVANTAFNPDGTEKFDLNRTSHSRDDM
jgi:hypothetical protein